jgi:hypothetical protein
MLTDLRREEGLRSEKAGAAALGISCLALAGVLALGSSACTEGSDRAPSQVIYDTIAGVEHVIGFDTGVWTEIGEGWTVDHGQAVEVGEMDGPDEYLFGEISGAVLDSDGRVHVADPQARNIRVFSPDGTFLRSVGGPGEGPGEFGHISGLAVAPEGIAALDGSLNRVTVFGPAGEVVRTVRLQRPSSVFEHNAPMAFDSDGRFFDRARLSRPDADSVGVAIYELSGDGVKTVILLVIERDQVMLEKGGAAYMAIPRPFAPEPSIAFGPDGEVFLSRGDEYWIQEFSPGGERVRVIRRSVQPTAITGHERDSVFTFISESFEAVGAALPPATRFPEFRPAIRRMIVDSDRHLWVLRGEDASAEGVNWSVHNPDGLYLGDVLLPDMVVFHIGREFVVGVTSDELGVQRALILPIVK